MDWAFNVNPAAFTWLFIGFIVGTFPPPQDGWQGGARASIAAGLAAVGHVRIYEMDGGSRSITVAQNFLNWVLMGGLIGLGV